MVGSGYIGHVVGGPRRSHPFRDRLARNTIGSWLSTKVALPSFSDLAASLRFGASAGGILFPTELAEVVSLAARKAFKRSDIPDLDLGLQRTVRHLEALARIKRPNLPDPPIPALSRALAGQPPSRPELKPLTTDPYYGSSSGGAYTPGADSQSKQGDACIVLLVIIGVGLLIGLINCIVTAIKDGKCKFVPEFPQELPPQGYYSSQEALVAWVTNEGVDTVQRMYEIQLHLWKAFDAAFNFLSISGLICPDDFLISSPLYTQFTSAPAPRDWPSRPIKDPGDYHIYPTSPLEKPKATPSMYPAGSTPMAILYGVTGIPTPTIWDVARSLWLQIVRGERDTQNLDLDADRGFGAECWRVAKGSSINDDPLKVKILQYEKL